MKPMKKQVVLWMMLCAGWILSPAAANTGIIPDPEVKGITETDPIDLEGDFDTGGLRSGGDAVTAEVQDGTIIGTFHKDLGDVLVTLTNGTGNRVYEATVNTSVQQQVFVPLSGLPSGIYTVTFSNEKGIMSGDVVI